MVRYKSKLGDGVFFCPFKVWFLIHLKIEFYSKPYCHSSRKSSGICHTCLSNLSFKEFIHLRAQLNQRNGSEMYKPLRSLFQVKSICVQFDWSLITSCIANHFVLGLLSTTASNPIISPFNGFKDSILSLSLPHFVHLKSSIHCWATSENSAETKLLS